MVETKERNSMEYLEGLVSYKHHDPDDEEEDDRDEDEPNPNLPIG